MKGDSNHTDADDGNQRDYATRFEQPHPLTGHNKGQDRQLRLTEDHYLVFSETPHKDPHENSLCKYPTEASDRHQNCLQAINIFWSISSMLCEII